MCERPGLQTTHGPASISWPRLAHAVPAAERKGCDVRGNVLSKPRK
jgi:hypothetical protein